MPAITYTVHYEGNNDMRDFKIIKHTIQIKFKCIIKHICFTGPLF